MPKSEDIKIEDWKGQKEAAEIIEDLMHHAQRLVELSELTLKSHLSKAVVRIYHNEAVMRSANIYKLRQKLAELLGEKGSD